MLKIGKILDYFNEKKNVNSRLCSNQIECFVFAIVANDSFDGHVQNQVMFIRLFILFAIQGCFQIL